MIVRFEIRGCDIPISIKKILKKITERDSEESGVIILQILRVRVFKSVQDLIIELFVRCVYILVDSPSFVMFKL